MSNAVKRSVQRNAIRSFYNELAKQFKDKNVHMSKVKKLVTLTLKNQCFAQGITYNKKRFSMMQQIPVMASLAALNKKELEALFIAFNIVPDPSKKTKKSDSQEQNDK